MSKQKNIAIKNLRNNPDNPREYNDGADLVASIRQEGLREPLVIVQVGENVYEVWRGNRRLDALARIHGPDSDYAVPCIVADKDADMLALILDHDSRPLSGDYELYLAAKCAAKYSPALETEQALCMRLRGVMDSALPPKGKKYSAILAAEQEGREADASRLYFEYRRGLVQYLTALVRGPAILRERIEQQQKDPAMSRIPQATIRAVYAAWRKNLGEALATGKEIDREELTGKALELWQEASSKTQDTTKAVKALSAGELTELCTQLTSPSLIKVLMAVATRDTAYIMALNELATANIKA